MFAQKSHAVAIVADHSFGCQLRTAATFVKHRDLFIHPYFPMTCFIHPHGEINIRIQEIKSFIKPIYFVKCFFPDRYCTERQTMIAWRKTLF